jgi:DNA/RNA endonuclease YhcR with UshA esterase domain
MKRAILPLLLGLLATITLMFNGCIKDDFDTPPVVIPQVDFHSNTTIAELKAMYSGGLDLITDTIIIQGIVVANDESGNFYKTIEIQDNTGGIEVKLNRTSLYTELKVGQRVLIKCKGLYLGNYGGLIQLGALYNDAIGQIPDIYIDTYLFRDSLAGTPPNPTVLTYPQFSAASLSTLVKIENIHFQEPGEVFALNYSIQSATNRDVVDDDGNVFTLRTSGYANFAASTMPKGKGSLIGILSLYNNAYQLYIRDLNDIVNWDTSAVVNTSIIEENFDADPPGWVKYSVASNHDWAWSSSFTCMAVNGYGADVASDDWLLSPAINLSGVQDAILSFRTWTRYTDSGLSNPLEVMISTNYSGTGDPTLASWTPIVCTLPAANSQNWTSSGDVDLTAYQGTVYIGFHYRSSGTASNSASSWEVDAFKVTGFAK